MFVDQQQQQQQKETNLLLNDKDVQILAKHAQQIAKRALGETEARWSGSGGGGGGGGLAAADLSHDIRVALNENYRTLKRALRDGKLTLVDFEQFSSLMRNALRRTLTDMCTLNFIFSLFHLLFSHKKSTPKYTEVP